jgi:hypothetical protein
MDKLVLTMIFCLLPAGAAGSSEEVTKHQLEADRIGPVVAGMTPKAVSKILGIEGLGHGLKGLI